MKKKTITIAAAITIITAFGFTGITIAQDSKTLPGNEPAFTAGISFAGVNNEQPAFRFVFENHGLKKPVIIIKDETNEVIYSENIQDNTARRTYQMNTPDSNDTVIFELYDGGKKVFTKSFRISRVTEVITDVAETDGR